MRNTLLVLAAHGAGDGSRANNRVHALASRLTHQLGLEVEAAFNLGAPSYEDAITSARQEEIIVVPLMMADGYFSRSTLPGRVQEAALESGARIEVTPPIGTWAEFEIAAVRAVSIELNDRSPPKRETTAVIVAHGTSLSATSGDSARRLADRVASELYVRGSCVAFIDQFPTIEHVLQERGGQHMTLVPMLLGGGRHALEDLPQSTRETGRVPPRLTPPIGDLVDLSPIIADEIRSRLERPIVRVGTRSSVLAQVQAEMTRAALERAGVRVVLTHMDTVGDRMKTHPLDAFESSSPFTDGLTQALRAGEIDVATHSLKDMPLQTDVDLPVVAYIDRHDPLEALVSRTDATLRGLPAGALVGSSSRRRSRQLLAIRPDLRVEPMRGDVEERVTQVERGEFDAALLAVAGLERLGLEHHITQRLTFDEIAPAPGQGIIALQAHGTDPALWAEVVDQPEVRAAAIAELSFAREAERMDPGAVVAASATVHDDGAVVLRVRLVGRTSTGQTDLQICGESAESVGVEAARRLLSASLLAAGEAR